MYWSTFKAIEVYSKGTFYKDVDCPVNNTRKIFDTYGIENIFVVLDE